MLDSLINQLLKLAMFFFLPIYFSFVFVTLLPVISGFTFFDKKKKES